MLMFYLINLTGISLPWQAFLLFSFCNSLNIFFLWISLKENDRLLLPITSLILRMLRCLSYFWIAQKTVSVILGLVILPPRLLSLLRMGTILLKNVFNVSAPSALLKCYALSMESLFEEKRTYSFPKFSIISNNFVVYVTEIVSLICTQNTHVEISLLIIQAFCFVLSFT